MERLSRSHGRKMGAHPHWARAAPEPRAVASLCAPLRHKGGGAKLPLTSGGPSPAS